MGSGHRLPYIWAPIGSRPRMVRDNRHTSAYLFGAICPDRAVGAAMIAPCANGWAMGQHPGRRRSPRPAGLRWRRLASAGQEAIAPGNITPPPCSPELNPMENVWANLRQNKLCALVCDSHEEIVQACVDARRS